MLSTTLLRKAGYVGSSLTEAVHSSDRHSTGEHPSGALAKLKKLIVRDNGLLDWRSDLCHLDVATRLGLIGPIADQCKHQ